MSNMSYCRFENTLRDLRDCARELDEIGGNLAELSTAEARAADQLIRLCAKISESHDNSKGGAA
jgi:hypothetical protein